MSGELNIHQKSQIARQLAYEELKKEPKYKLMPIPNSVIDEKMKDYMKLSDEEIQKKFNEFWNPDNKQKGLWGSMGLNIPGVNEESKLPVYKKPTTKMNAQMQKDADTRSNAITILLDNAKMAKTMVENYHNNIGYISSDAFVQGMNVIGDKIWDGITGRNDFATVFEQEDALDNEIKQLQSLESKSKSSKIFEKEFKKLYGIDFNYQAFEKLNTANDKLNKANSYEALSKYLDEGIKQLEKIDTNSFDLDAYLAPLFGNHPIQTRNYINQLKSTCKDENELKVKVYAVLAESKKNIDKDYQELMKGTTKAQLENDYKSAYKGAMGDYKSDDIIADYIKASKTNAMISEAGLLLVGSYLAAGSKLVAGMGSRVMAQYGPKLGGHIMKAGMTATMASMPAAETIVSGLTSKDGMTLQKGEEAFEQLKNGLMYGSFGAYVSGPLGNMVQNVLSKNPQVFTSIISSTMSSKVVGATVETTADIIFDRLTSDVSIKESLAQNGLINYAMMFSGSNANQLKQSMSDIYVEKLKDGTYNISDVDGNFIGKAKDDNELSVAILGIGKNIYDKVKTKAKDVIVNHTEVGRKLKEGVDRARYSASNSFRTTGQSNFEKIKSDVSDKLKNNFSEVTESLVQDSEFMRLFNSFMQKNTANKPELKEMFLHYDLSGMNDAKLIKSLIETSGVGITKIAQIISKDKSIMAKFEASLPPEEFKSLEDALINCQSKCDFSRTIEEAQIELDKAFPINGRNTKAVSVPGAPRGEYTITSEISAGSVGATYWALDSEGNKVVVKMLKDGVDMEQLGMEEKLFKKLMSTIASTPEDAHRYSVMIHNQYKDWYQELDFKQEAIYNKKLAEGAKRYTVANVTKVSKDGTSLIMDCAKGVQMNKLVKMLEFYKQNPDEYAKTYKEEIESNPWVANPQMILEELPTTLLKTFDEQMLFMKKGGETVMHGDPHMGNIFVYQDKDNKLKIEFIDTGNCVTRNSDQIKGDIAFFSNYLVGNSEGVAKYFMDKAGVDSNADPELLQNLSNSIDERIFKKGENITQFANVQKELNTILEEHGLEIGADESNALKAQFQFISNVSTLNALSGKPLDIGALFADIPGALTSMVRNGVNPISSVWGAVKYTYNNTVDAISNALQFKIKKPQEPEVKSTDLVEVQVSDNKTLKFTRKVLSDVKDYIKKRNTMTDEEKFNMINQIAQEAQVVRSQIEQLISHLTTK